MPIKWSGPRKGPGSVESIVSHMPQVKAKLRRHADSIADHAGSTLLVHRSTGDAQIKAVHTPTTDLDSYVILSATGGEKPKRAPLSIENGHWMKRGEELVWVEGIHPLAKAVANEVRRKALST